jgi:hypothetical protein
VLRIQRDPEVVWGPSGFMEAWCTKAEKPRFVQKPVSFGLASFGGKANQHIRCFVGFGTPDFQKKHLDKKPLRDPFDGSPWQRPESGAHLVFQDQCVFRLGCALAVCNA